MKKIVTYSFVLSMLILLSMFLPYRVIYEYGEWYDTKDLLNKYYDSGFQINETLLVYSVLTIPLILRFRNNLITNLISFGLLLFYLFYLFILAIIIDLAKTLQFENDNYYENAIGLGFYICCIAAITLTVLVFINLVRKFKSRKRTHPKNEMLIDDF